jgi:hypothetical protein
LLIIVSLVHKRDLDSAESTFAGYRIDLFRRNGFACQWIPEHDSVSELVFFDGESGLIHLRAVSLKRTSWVNDTSNPAIS